MNRFFAAASLLPLCINAWGQTPMMSKLSMIHSPGKWRINFRTFRAPLDSPFRHVSDSVSGQRETKVMNGILRQMKLAHTQASSSYSVPELYYENSAALWCSQSDVLSFEATGEYYLGGAHGMSNVRTYNFGFVQGKQSRFAIWDALLATPAAKSTLQYLLLTKAMKNEHCAWIDEGMIWSFTETQMQRFLVTPKGLRFPFDPYELGSYADGRIDLEIPYSELKGIIRTNGPLSRFVNKK